jgi:hypothetical protein
MLATEAPGSGSGFSREFSFVSQDCYSRLKPYVQIRKTKKSSVVLATHTIRSLQQYFVFAGKAMMQMSDIGIS